MRVFYDLHIHTALSPCADEDMTPCNIVNMAKLKQLDVIAITDHNSTLNSRAVFEASKRLNGPLVIAGVELSLSEDIHAILLFEDLESAARCNAEIDKRRFKIKNNVKVFSPQLILDSFDNIVGHEDNLLIAPTDISVQELPIFAAKYDAVYFFAHIERQSNGILAVLGEFPPEIHDCAVEVNAEPDEALKARLSKINAKILYDSDSHFLGAINENEHNYLEVDALDTKSILAALKP